MILDLLYQCGEKLKVYDQGAWRDGVVTRTSPGSVDMSWRANSGRIRLVCAHSPAMLRPSLGANRYVDLSSLTSALDLISNGGIRRGEMGIITAITGSGRTRFARGNANG